MTPVVDMTLRVGNLVEKLSRYRRLFGDDYISDTLQRLIDNTSITPHIKDFTDIIVAAMMGIVYAGGVNPEIAMNNAIIRMEHILDNGDCPFFDPTIVPDDKVASGPTIV